MQNHILLITTIALKISGVQKLGYNRLYFSDFLHSLCQGAFTKFFPKGGDILELN